MKLVHRILLLALALALSGCATRPAPAAQAVEPPSDIAPDRLRDTALFLAGLPGAPNGPFHALEETPAWHDYAERFNKTWDSLEKEQFALVRAFEERELKPVIPADAFLFYPFSGPDVLYATQLFPRQRVLMMAGLEPVGTVKDPAQYQPATLPTELNAWSGILNSIMRRSFFITSEMNRQLKVQHNAADGLLPVMMALLARSGFTTTSVRFGAISAAGEFVTPAEKPTAMELRFKASSGEQKTLYYASGDIGAPWSATTSLGLFVHNLGTPVTFIKSASFLPHTVPFAALRNQILESSAAVLQDDTGVPYRFFKTPAWSLRLYGNYTAPQGSFARMFQKDLAEAFAARTTPLELEFPIGYGFRRRGSSLILALRAKASP